MAPSLVACSADSGTPGAAPDQPPKQTSEQVPEGRFSTAQQLGEAVRDAALDAGSARGVVEARNSDGLFSGVAAYEFRSDGVLLAGEVSVSEPVSAELGVVRIPDATYVRVPPAAAVFTGSQWLRVREDDDSDLAGQITALTEALGAELPGTSLMLDERRDATVSYRGEERLEGQDVERYLVEWDDGTVTTTEEYWIDPDDRVLRVDSVQQGPVGVTAESRRAYADWGDPVVVEAPPADEVGELPDGFF